LLGEMRVLPRDFALERIALLTVIEATLSGSSSAVTFSIVSFGRPCTREIQASAAR
jgi:hypothetical protein